MTEIWTYIYMWTRHGRNHQLERATTWHDISWPIILGHGRPQPITWWLTGLACGFSFTWMPYATSTYVLAWTEKLKLHIWFIRRLLCRFAVREDTRRLDRTTGKEKQNVRPNATVSSYSQLWALDVTPKFLDGWDSRLRLVQLINLNIFWLTWPRRLCFGNCFLTL